MELGSYFLFLQEQIKDIIIIRGAWALRECTCPPYKCYHACECIQGNDCEAPQTGRPRTRAVCAKLRSGAEHYKRL